MSRAPPSDSSEPRVEAWVEVVPLSSPPAVGSTANGRGKIVRGEETETTRSSARRYGGRYLYRFLGSRISSARRWTVCGGWFAKFLERVARIDA